ncbi:ATP-dependent DNA helicase PcrA [Stieleria maiorica]|uniref:DNA 3'-5' helicase n=1 Tax=Stieleria maiorica TaxID=2795974 RepID=A0A5B9MRA0_9BACT|nr:ATP-dependent helicase [Stieleria maiorica]QEG01558.1 ATP-dependent DNA helicase PcrA [Stieleria maiorica]
MTDRIELARRRAAELHAAAVSDGGDPSKPYDFVCREAARLEIDVSRVPVDDVRLCGGRALFDPEAWLILHEDSGSAFTDAFLVAHEIGHVEFGGEAEFLAITDIDPERSSGSTGVGTDRVVDYSNRARREVQMDLFARELLLPRNWIRTLHLEQEQTASQIAALIDAPLPVVFQQLLDAIFLPELVEEYKPEVAIKYNDRQLEAMRFSGENAFLLKAGPGTGKTRTLIGRIEHLVSTGVSPERILVLTFSNKAAGELSDRLATMNPDAAARVWVGTFHSFGLDIVRRFHDLLNLPSDPRLIDRAEAIEMLEGVYAGLELNHLKNLQYPSLEIRRALDAISRAHDEVVGPDRYRSLAETMRANASEEKAITRAEECLDVATIFEAYEELKISRGGVDFGNLVSLPVKLCEEISDVQEHLSSLYEHVLVDEFQDVNRASVRLLKALSPSGKNLWVVGDARQSIYRFRGASLFNMQRFCEDDFPGGTTGELDLSYRSVPEISGTVYQFANSMVDVSDDTTSIETTRDSMEHRPELRVVEKKTDEVAAIADAIVTMRDDGYSYRKQAVLCSGNDRLAQLANDLEHRGIPVLFLGNVFERSEIRDLLSIVSLMADRRAMGLLRIATMNEFSMRLSDASALIDHLRASSTPAMKWLSDSLDDVELTEQGVASLERLQAALAGFHPGSHPWILLATLLFDRTRIAANLAMADDVSSRAQGIAIWQLMNFARLIPAGEGTPTFRLLDRIRHLVLNSDDRELRQLPKAAESIDAVRLMTMHGSKGLESPVVHIPGLNSSSIPLSAGFQLSRKITPPDGMIEGTSESGYDAVKNGLENEQACLLFVALSRAEDRLFLYRNKKRSDDARQSPSKFLECLQGHVDEWEIEADGEVAADQETDAWRVTVEEPISVTDHQVRLYDKCPRRFLYSHILQTGGRRTETQYMQLHAAVQDVVQHVASNHISRPSRDEAERLLENAMVQRGFSADASSVEYRKIAVDLVRFLIECASGAETLPPEPMIVQITGGTIEIVPDQVVRREDGSLSIQRIRTGHVVKKDVESIESKAFVLGTEGLSERTVAEVVHLSDGKVTPLPTSARKLDNAQKRLDEIGLEILSGKFGLKTSDTCPLCPAYFVCGKLPAGELSKKISA